MKTLRFFLLLFPIVLSTACSGNATTNTTENTATVNSETTTDTVVKISVPAAKQATKLPAEEAAPPKLKPDAPTTPPAAAQKPTVTEQVSTATDAIAPEKEETRAETVPPVRPAPPSHAAWDQLLQQFVSSTGNVNYKGFKDAEQQLDKYLENLAANPIQDSWSRNEKMAYWINAYNAFTVKLIVENYPTTSITNLKGGKPWDVKWIKLGEKTYSLNNIENDILRPRYQDARIHFAVNCAAQSCPPLLNRAWTADNLNRNFEKQAKAFINNSKYNTIQSDAVQISKIFEWYAEDFGNIIDYLNQYSNTKIDADAKVSYREYDWTLNE